MAEDVNFPLDQTRNTGTFQFLREAWRHAWSYFRESANGLAKTFDTPHRTNRVEEPENRIQEVLVTNSLLGSRLF